MRVCLSLLSHTSHVLTLLSKMSGFTQKAINRAFGADNDRQYGDYVSDACFWYHMYVFVVTKKVV